MFSQRHSTTKELSASRASTLASLRRRLSIEPAGSCHERAAELAAAQALDGGPIARLSPAGPILQRHAGAADAVPAAAPPVVHDAIAEPGRALGESAGTWARTRLGHDFGRVRVHTGPVAERSAQAVGALAYTVGQHVVFGAGQYRPETQAGRRLLAHELAHTVQQRGGGEALMAYRPKGSVSFGVRDTAALKEQEWEAKKADELPWIEQITVNFDGTTTDSDGDIVPTGTIEATYASNKAAEAGSTLKAGIVGGKASEGLSDRGTTKVSRIEGWGYHHASVPKAERVTGHKRGYKYYKPSLAAANASMSFAIFFREGKSTGNQAIHEGSLTMGSLACVHISDTSIIQQMNYHTVKGKTKVTIAYAAGALQTVCCARHAVKGYMVSNPCGGQDPKKCP